MTNGYAERAVKKEHPEKGKIKTGSQKDKSGEVKTKDPKKPLTGEKVEKVLP